MSVNLVDNSTCNDMLSNRRQATARTNALLTMTPYKETENITCKTSGLTMNQCEPNVGTQLDY